MGPPPLPPHALRKQSKEGRQLPPHLVEISPSATAPRGRLSSRDSKFSSENSAAPRPPSQSPALSHASAVLVSPSLVSPSLPHLSAPELDEVRKDVMQSAAARAKQRRQQEEEEREKEKERARRKAAEIEQRMKVADVDKAKLDGEAKPAEPEVRPVVIISILLAEHPLIGWCSDCHYRGSGEERQIPSGYSPPITASASGCWANCTSDSTADSTSFGSSLADISARIHKHCCSGVCDHDDAGGTDRVLEK
jgi:hypothetical protein